MRESPGHGSWLSVYKAATMRPVSGLDRPLNIVQGDVFIGVFPASGLQFRGCKLIKG